MFFAWQTEARRRVLTMCHVMCAGTAGPLFSLLQPVDDTNGSASSAAAASSGADLRKCLELFLQRELLDQENTWSGSGRHHHAGYPAH